MKRRNLYVGMAALLIAMEGRSGQVAGADTPAAPVPDSVQPPAAPAPVWPRFHGPNGAGLATAAATPVEWNAATGRNIRWRLAIPLPGLSSPVIRGDRLFLTGADTASQRLFAIDRINGTIAWERPVACERPFPADDIHVDGSVGYAAPTPALDGDMLVVAFATGDIAAFDVEGKPLWSRNLGKPESAFGLAASPVIGDDKVFLQYPRDGKQEILALDKRTGQTRWSVSPADMEESWATPLLIDAGKRRELVFLAGPGFLAFDPGTGRALWRAAGIDGQIGPSPLYLGDTLYGAQAGASLMAVRAGGEGDVTRTHVRWQVRNELPDTASPATDGTRLYLAAIDEVSCYHAASGALLWKQPLEGVHYSSPVVAGDKVYATTRDGLTRVFKTGDRYEQLGQGEVGEPVDSTLAVAGDSVYVRGDKHLFCIREGTK